MLANSICRTVPKGMPGAPFKRTARLPRVRAQGRRQGSWPILLDQRAPAAEWPLQTKPGCWATVPWQAWPSEDTCTCLSAHRQLAPLRLQHSPPPGLSSCTQMPHPALLSLCSLHNRAVGQDWLPDPGPNQSHLETVPSCRGEVSQPAAATLTHSLPLTVPWAHGPQGM